MKQQVNNRRKKGFTLIEIMIVVSIIAILLTMALPSYEKARTTSQNNCCLHNLKEIESGKEQLTLANTKMDGADVQWGDLIPAYIKYQPQCPAGGVYTPEVIGAKPDCSIQGHDLP